VEIVKGPYLQWPTPESMTVMWETSAPSSSRVTWWETEPVHSGLGGRARTLVESTAEVTDAAEKRVHRLMVGGLAPATTYHYRVDSRTADGIAVESDSHPLKTAPLTGTPFSFAVTSETGGYGDDQINRRLFEEIARHRPDFLLVVGDAVANGAEYGDWARWFFDPGRELLHSTPFYLCLGNHEEGSRAPAGGPYAPARTWFHEFTAFPEPGTFYGFDYGDVHFTALDSTSLVDYVDGVPRATGELEPGSPQLHFLAEDLAAADAKWKIAFYHYPPYVSGDYEVASMRELGPMLEQGGVQVVFSSHTIVYERSHPLRGGELDEEKGIVYIVAGGAGAKADWLHPKRAWHTAQSRAVPHFVQGVVAGRRLELRAIDQDGQVFDWLTLAAPEGEAGGLGCIMRRSRGRRREGTRTA